MVFNSHCTPAFAIHPGRRLPRAVVCLVATLIVLFLPLRISAQPLNDNFINATILSGSSGGVLGTTINATYEFGEPLHANVIGGRSVWYRWTAPLTGQVEFNTCQQTNFDTLLAIYTGSSVGSLVPIASNDDGCNAQSRVVFNATAGVTYRIAVDGYLGISGVFGLIWFYRPPANDSFAQATVLTGLSGSRSGSNVGATKEPNEPAHAGNSGGASVWFRWQAPGFGDARFRTCTGTTFDTLLAVYTLNQSGNLVLVASNDDQCGLQSDLQFFAIRNQPYWIAVDGFNGAMGSYQLSFTLNLRPPNDNRSDSLPLQGENGFFAWDNRGATIEPNEPAHGQSGGGSSVWFRWQAPARGRLTLNTCNGAEFPTILAVYRYVGNSPTLLAASEGSPLCGGLSFLSLSVAAGEEYWIAVDGTGGQQGDFALQYAFDRPPANDRQTDAQSIAGTSGFVDGTTVGATLDTGEVPIEQISTGASVWYRWVAPVTGVMDFETCHPTNVASGLAAYLRTDGGQLIPLGSDYTACGNRGGRVSLRADQGLTYLIVVDGFAGLTNPFRLSWSGRELPTGVPLQTSGLGNGPLALDASLSPLGRFVSSSARGAVVWDIAAREPARLINVRDGNCRALAVAPERGLIVTADDS